MTVRRAVRWHTRVFAATVLLLMAGVPAWAAIFSDIQGLPMQRAIERLAAKGVFRGTSGTTFNP
ncbi:MAG: S-layer homology domain-containing protein, partial [bacterium]